MSVTWNGPVGKSQPVLAVDSSSVGAVPGARGVLLPGKVLCIVGSFVSVLWGLWAAGLLWWYVAYETRVVERLEWAGERLFGLTGLSRVDWWLWLGLSPFPNELGVGVGLGCLVGGVLGACILCSVWRVVHRGITVGRVANTRVPGFVRVNL